MNYKVEEEYGTYEKGLETVQRTNWWLGETSM